MLNKLIWRSFFKQFRNYMIYFVAMILAVMIYYSFGAMTYDQPLMGGVNQDLQLGAILDVANFFVLLIVLFFVLSANRFFLTRRLKEVALYRLFGLKRRRIVAQFLVEIFCLNVLSFLVGILLGIIFSKLFAMILAKAMGLNLISNFFVSRQSIALTANVFTVVFFVSAFQTIWLLAKSRLTDLFQEPQRATAKLAKVHWPTYVLGILGGLLLVAAYLLAFYMQPILAKIANQGENVGGIMQLPVLLFLALVLGTYLFFRFTIKLLLYLLSKSPFGFKRLAFYDITKSRVAIQKNWRNLSLVTVLTALALAVIGITMSVVAVNSDADVKNNPTAFQLTDGTKPAFEKILKENGGTVSQEVQLNFKLSGVFLSDGTHQAGAVANLTLMNFISLSNYQAFAQKIKTAPKITLGKNQAGVLFDNNYLIFTSLSTKYQQVVLPGEQKISVQSLRQDVFGDDRMRYDASVMVVSDETYGQIKGVSYPVYLVDTSQVSEEQLSEQVEKAIDVNWSEDVYFDYYFNKQVLTGQISASKLPISENPQHYSSSYSRLNIQNRYPVLRASRRINGIFIYVALFIGTIGSIVTASILMLRRISESEEELKDWRLLLKVGVQTSQVKGMIYRQEFWFFAPAVFLIALNAGMAIYAASQFIFSPFYWLAYLFIGVMALCYGFTYLFTVRFFIHNLENL